MLRPSFLTAPIHCSAPDDVPNSDKIRSLLKDIREARQAKSREGLSKIDHSELGVCISSAHLFNPGSTPSDATFFLQLPNLCSMEINEIRPFFIRAMGVLTQINHAEREDEP